jgi:hypothetical protein
MMIDIIVHLLIVGWNHVCLGTYLMLCILGMVLGKIMALSNA